LAEIRVDQSHCNHHLSEILGARGWQILFRDSGRVTRGGTGTQGICLNIFEQSGLPIPDIIAVQGPLLLLLEVDSSVLKATLSLQTYKRRAEYLIGRFRAIPELEGLDTLLTGFCRTNIVTDSPRQMKSIFIQLPDLDLCVVFSEPRLPSLLWRNPMPF
jgi:hypothetical protein